jgi:[acyl-carrier-protein] S-malonyltransferase
MDVVLLFPGQGAQAPGMGKDLAAAFPAARDTFSEADQALGVPLSTLCFEGPAEELRATHNAQPALLAHGAAVWQVTRAALSPHVRAAAGHSLGEFTAYHAADSLPVGAAVALVRRRGELMHDAGSRHPGTMAAVLGELREPIAAICEQASAEAGIVVPANYNSPEQVVISGEISGVGRAMELAREAGAKRTLALNVSGAFHSPLMEPSAEGLRGALAAARLREPGFPIFSNVTTTACATASEAESLLFRQLTAPVRWQGLVENLASIWPNALFVEMGPGNVLTSLMKRIAPKAQAMACGTVAQVDKVLTLVA